MPPSLARSRGRRVHGERFARIPLDVLLHVACTTLTGSEHRVLVIFAANYNGANNGALACTQSWAEQFGITGTDTVGNARRVLTARRLIEVTRPGMRMRKVPTLYALAWAPINNRDGQPLIPPGMPTWGFKDWKPEISDPAGRGDVTPGSGVQTADYTPICPVTRPVLTPRIGDTLRSYTGSPSGSGSRSGRLVRPNPSAGRRSDRDSLKSGLIALTNKLPHFTASH